VSLQGKQLLIYPNPGKGQMTFAFQPVDTGEARVEIYNFRGERVSVVSTQVDSEHVAYITWNCGAVAPGMYVARVGQDGKEIGKSKVAVVR